MRSRTLGAVCATCAVAVPVSAEAQAQAPAPAPVPVPVPVPLPAAGPVPVPAAAPVPVPAAPPAPAAAPPSLSSGGFVAGQPPSEIADARQLARLKRYLKLEGRRRSLKGERLSMRERDRLGAELRTLTPQRLLAETRELRRDLRALRRKVDRARHGGAPDVPVPAALGSIARCESGGNPRAISAGGTYRGKYQFDHATWGSVGGKGDPAAASETEQDRRAALLYKRSGAAPWPVCGSA